MVARTGHDSISSLRSLQSNGSSKGGCIDIPSKQRVRFFPKLIIRRTTHLNNYSDEEIENCWYTKKEKARMEAKRIKIVARIIAGKPAKVGQTYRGLEKWTEEGEKLAATSVENCVNAVLDEQDHQWDTGVDNPARFAVLSRSASRECLDWALELAMQDEIDVAKAWGSDAADCLTDDESACGMAHIVAAKRAQRRRRIKLEQNDKNKDIRKGKRKETSKEPSSSSSKGRRRASESTKKTMNALTGMNASPPTKKISKMRLKKHLFTANNKGEEQLPASPMKSQRGSNFWNH